MTTKQICDFYKQLLWASSNSSRESNSNLPPSSNLYVGPGQASSSSVTNYVAQVAAYAAVQSNTVQKAKGSVVFVTNEELLLEKMAKSQSAPRTLKGLREWEYTCVTAV